MEPSEPQLPPEEDAKNKALVVWNPTLDGGFILEHRADLLTKLGRILMFMH